VRVLYVNQTAAVSGAERSLLDILSGLGDAVEAVVACPEGELAEAVRAGGFRYEPIAGTQASFRLHPVHTSRGIYDIGRSAVQLRALVKTTGPDIVHANTTRASLLAIAARRRRLPILAQIRDWSPDGWMPRAVNGFVSVGADLVVANSGYVAGQFARLPKRRPVEVVHDPVDLAAFQPSASRRDQERRTLGIKPPTVVLVVVAQLTPWKGQDDAIRALAELRRRGRDVTLLLTGSVIFSGGGTNFDNVAYARGLHQLADELGVSDRVRFLGERADVPAVLDAADIALLPSWREAYGRIAVEAMAMGLPVVATDIGGPPELVREGVDGLLLRPREPVLWAQRIEPLVDDAELRARISRAARERSRQFDVPERMRQLLSIYRDLAGGG
jgi:glycosyltransferase involved in cell wall biosynthesis